MAYLQGLNMFTTWMRDDGLTWVIGRDQGIHIQLSHKQNQSQFFTRFPDVTIGPPLGVLVYFFIKFFFIIGSMRISSVPMTPLYDDSDTPPAFIKLSKKYIDKREKKDIKKKDHH